MAEKWNLKGEFAITCICSVPCPCNLGQNPTQGHCNGVICFDITKGKYGKVDLSGTRAGMAVQIPGFVFDGNWQLAIYTDEKNSKEQQDALVEIITGTAGGPFEQLAALVGKVVATKSVPIEWSDGLNPSFQLGKTGSVKVETIIGIDEKNPVRMVNGLFGLRDDIRLGKTSSTFSDPELGWNFQLLHAESEEFEFAP
jgi:hypothetical protein